MNSKRHITGLSLTALAVAIAGCASTEPNQSLEQARSAVQSAGNDPEVVAAAAIELDQARDSLAAAEAIYREEGNDEPELLEHETYLARRYAETAIAIADEARADTQIEQAEAERSRVLLEIRTAEAEQREAEAERAELIAAQNARQAELERQRALSAQERAQAAQAQAQSAQARAESLADQLDDLEAQQTDRGLVLTLGDVLFDFDEADLKPGASNTIDQLADFLNEYPERELVIEGHTDSVGPEQYNEQLSLRRASAVAMALEQRGIPDGRLETRGLGEARPVANNDTDAGRQQNRRVEVIVTQAM